MSFLEFKDFFFCVLDIFDINLMVFHGLSVALNIVKTTGLLTYSFEFFTRITSWICFVTYYSI